MADNGDRLGAITVATLNLYQSSNVRVPVSLLWNLPSISRLRTWELMFAATPMRLMRPAS